jgi:exportin-1
VLHDKSFVNVLTLKAVFASWKQVLKHEWPARWKTFIPDLVSAAKSSETICENCMAILKVNNFSFYFLDSLKFIM